METLEVKGVPVEIHTAGSGPPLLYLHAEQYFEQVRPYLDALAKKWTVIAPRHPGWGSTSVPTDFRSVDDLMAAIERLVAETNADPKPFVWTANPKRILAVVKRGKEKLESIH